MRHACRGSFLVLLVAGATAAGCGSSDAPGGSRAMRTHQAATVCPEPVTTGDDGEPRNAAGNVRTCWPGEDQCTCDDNNDCWAQDGYIPCDPPGSGDVDGGDGGDPAADASVDPDATVGMGDTGGGGSSGGDNTAVPVTLDPATDSHVRDLVALGAASGNARDVVAKIGDSITESASYMQDCGNGWYTLDAYGWLQPTIGYFTQHTLLDGSNSFNRASVAAVGGTTTVDVLAGGDPASPLARELDALHPQWAVVMFGTNDVDYLDVGTFAANMGRIVDMAEARHVVTIVSTIPPRLDGLPSQSLVPTFNQAIMDLASSRHIPLVDYHGALQGLPNQGISPDGIHPDVYQGENGCVFTPDALQDGYNVRNLTTLQMLYLLQTTY